VSEGMNADQIERVFGALARIEQKIDGHIDTVKDHMDHDQLVQTEIFKRVETLQMASAKQRGYMTAMGAIGGVLVTAIGYVVDKMLGHH